MEPITVEEVGRARKSTSKSAAGPDGVTYEDLLEIPLNALTVAFNLWLLAGKVPTRFSHNRTVFIPKVRQPTEAKDFRPITIGSHVSRLFYRILALRINRFCPVDEVQKAFRPVDGCNENVALLDCVIAKSSRLECTTHLAFLDMAKAFDSVSHHTLSRVMERAGIPPPLRDLVMDGYAHATTQVSYGESSLSPGQINRGVKQGCPLSSVLFNLVLDEVIQSVKGDSVVPGVEIGEGQKVSILAFADDLVLTASSQVGLQTLTDRVLELLGAGGLEPNPRKCKTLSVLVDGKLKRFAIDPVPFLRIAGTICPALKASESYRYLGIRFGGLGKVASYMEILKDGLANIRRAPLKPQQRLHILVRHLVPKLLHSLILGTVRRTQLAAADREIRVAVKAWLRLPPDTPDAFLYAQAADGGLEIPCLSTRVPLQKQSRLGKLSGSTDPAVLVASRSPKCLRDIRYWAGPVKVKNTLARTVDDVRSAFARNLVHTVDGLGLTPATEYPRGNKWIVGDTSWVSGADFIRAVGVRSGTLQTPLRLARGRPPGTATVCTTCGCEASLGHIVQSCPRNHGMRVRRHDNIVDYAGSALRDRGWTVFVEPSIPWRGTTLKPDLVITKAGQGVQILDAQVVADKFGMSAHHGRKVDKYNQPDLRRTVASVYGAPVSHVGSITLNYRGLWHGTSARHLRSLGLSDRTLAVCSLKALTWSHSMFRTWNSSGRGARNHPA